MVLVFRLVDFDHLRAYLRATLLSLFAPVPTFFFFRREHLKQRDKWRPHDCLHSGDQVSLLDRKHQTPLVADNVRSMSREMCN